MIKRRTRSSLQRRARLHARGYETPTHKLDAFDAEHRVYFAWLSGYEAAKRDAQRDK